MRVRGDAACAWGCHCMPRYIKGLLGVSMCISFVLGPIASATRSTLVVSTALRTTPCPRVIFVSNRNILPESFTGTIPHQGIAHKKPASVWLSRAACASTIKKNGCQHTKQPTHTGTLSGTYTDVLCALHMLCVRVCTCAIHECVRACVCMCVYASVRTCLYACVRVATVPSINIFSHQDLIPRTKQPRHSPATKQPRTQQYHSVQ